MRWLSRCMMAALGALLTTGSLSAAQLDLSESPLFVGGTRASLVQLILARDNKLFFEVYPSYEDLNGDGVVDNRYKPAEIDYSGYFNSYSCYAEIAGSHLNPIASTTDKTCATGWSGDFLNFLTMTRIDMLRFALYGGKRLIDSDTQTRLRRAFVPIDYHTWGNEYESIAVDGYDISDYSPLALPTAGTRHLFATNNVNMDDVPYLRIREDRSDRIYDWIEVEGPQGIGAADQDIALDVNVCVTGLLEDNCRLYPDGNYKPIGILHEYSDGDSMYFSLLTGSYENNLQGGVLRQSMRSFNSIEVESNSGIYTTADGIVSTIDNIRIYNDFSGSTHNDCPRTMTTPMSNGECSAWGNPVAEMMYEGLRYLSGASTPTSMFNTSGGLDDALGLTSATWDDPYADSQPYEECSPAYQLVISDPSPSFDSDDLPGSDFSSFSDSSLGSLNVATLADTIYAQELGGPTVQFIGESDSVVDRSATAKDVNSFKNIRGISPEEPHRQGSYYASSVSYYGNSNDLHDLAEGTQSVGNFTLALGSPVPTIDVNVDGQTISFSPFSRTIGSWGDGSSIDYAPVNAIVGFTVESLTSTTGSYRVSFEDAEQGADNDMDALVRYSYEVIGNTVEMTVNNIYSSTRYIQHSGFSITGSTQDGVYLLVRNRTSHDINNDIDYILDVPPGMSPGSGYNDGVPLPLTSVTTYTADTTGTSTANALKPPLWYAAKWGGFEDRNGDGYPQQAEWDSDLDGQPDNYLPVTNPSNLSETLRSVFEEISISTATGSAVAVTSGSLDAGDRIYQSEFVSGLWTGVMRSFSIDAQGTIGTDEDWNINLPLTTQIANDDREILTYNPVEETGIAFQWPANQGSPTAEELSLAQVIALRTNPRTGAIDNKGSNRLSFLRGNSELGFRSRSEPMGDIVNSSPVVVGAPEFFYPDDWGVGAAENATPYSTFGRANTTRQRVVYVGANDGMLHAFDAGTFQTSDWDAGTGSELFSYIPNSLYTKLPELTVPSYQHHFYVDATPRVGDAHLGSAGWRTVLVGGLRKGAQGIYALDVTNPGAISEATAASTVLWEFSDADDADLGYTYSSPVIVRMHNGRWAAVFGNGYNNSEADGNASTTGNSALFIVDLETGQLVRKFLTGQGSVANPNGMAEPTAVDLDGDNIIDIIYAGDLQGNIWGFDVRSDNANNWSLIDSDNKFQARTIGDQVAPITTRIAVGSHPTGQGIMLFAGSGKFLEQTDLDASTDAHRLYGLWDKTPFSTSYVQNGLSNGSLLQQTVTSETLRMLDTDGDGIDDAEFEVRQTSQNAIDWDVHAGWYLDLQYGVALGEKIVSEPILREGRIIVNTAITGGNTCEPSQDGWLMILDAVSGSMEESSPLDLDGDGIFDTELPLTGIRGIGNSLVRGTITSAAGEDVIIQQSSGDSPISTLTLDAQQQEGRLTWRELEP